MKLSSKILLGTALGVWALLTITLVILARLVSGGAGDAPDQQASHAGDQIAHAVTVPWNDEPFNRIAVEGAWTITIDEGPACSVDVHVPQSHADAVTLQHLDSMLVCRLNAPAVGQDQCRLHIVLPDLSLLRMHGRGHAVLNDLSLDSLRVETEGMTNVTTENTLIGSLVLRSEGMSWFTFRDQGVTNADIRAEGMGNIRVHMRGGIVTGRVQGMTNLDLTGDIAENTLVTEGMVSR